MFSTFYSLFHYHIVKNNEQNKFINLIYSINIQTRILKVLQVLFNNYFNKKMFYVFKTSVTW